MEQAKSNLQLARMVCQIYKVYYIGAASQNCCFNFLYKSLKTLRMKDDKIMIKLEKEVE